MGDAGLSARAGSEEAGARLEDMAEELRGLMEGVGEELRPEWGHPSRVQRWHALVDRASTPQVRARRRPPTSRPRPALLTCTVPGCAAGAQGHLCYCMRVLCPRSDASDWLPGHMSCALSWFQRLLFFHGCLA